MDPTQPVAPPQPPAFGAPNTLASIIAAASDLGANPFRLNSAQGANPFGMASLGAPATAQPSWTQMLGMKPPAVAPSGLIAPPPTIGPVI